MQVDFGYRFDRDPVSHGEAVAVRTRLAELYAKDVRSAQAVSRIEFYPVARVGKSGSEVFYCDIWIQGVGFPRRHIAKFQSRRRTEDEYIAALNARHAQLCSEVSRHLDDDADLGIIIYDLARAKDHREFRGIFLDPDVPDEFCADALTAGLRDVGRFPNDEAPRLTVHEDFRDYIERRTNPIGKLKALVKAKGDWHPMASAAEKILAALTEIGTRADHVVLPHLVHGDLHARNLMVDAENAHLTELIDFDWVHYGHPAKDLVLMEATLKYMLLPELVQKCLGRQGSLSMAAIVEFENVLALHRFDLPDTSTFLSRMAPLLDDGDGGAALKGPMLRTYNCLVAVRTAARNVLQAYCGRLGGAVDAEREYMTALFLVTLGLFGIQETERFWALAGLERLVPEVSAR